MTSLLREPGELLMEIADQESGARDELIAQKVLFKIDEQYEFRPPREYSLMVIKAIDDFKAGRLTDNDPVSYPHIFKWPNPANPPIFKDLITDLGLQEFVY